MASKGKFYVLEPEVPAGLGERTVIADRSVHPPIIAKLHLEFMGWMGDDLMECFPCFLITEKLAKALEKEFPDGYELDEVLVDISDEYDELHPATELPKIHWLKINGQAGIDDFGTCPKSQRLVISKKVLNLLKKHNFNHCDIEDFETK